MSLLDSSPDGSAWAHCLGPGWAITWPTPPDTVNLVIGRATRRPAPHKLARYSAAWAPDPPPATTVLDWLANHRPPRHPIRGLPHLYRHWRWWRRNLTARRLRRGDLRMHALAADGDLTAYAPALCSAPQPTRLDLRDRARYTTLISISLHNADIWTRRRLRRGTVTITTTPPTGPARWLWWTRRARGDLTWAPRPPQPQHALDARRHGRRTSGPEPTRFGAWGPGNPLWRATYIDPYVLPNHPANGALHPAERR